LKYGKHAAVRASFHRDFVKRGVVPAKMGKLFDRLFYDRQEADYAVFVKFDQDVVANEIEEVEEFLTVFRSILEKKELIYHSPSTVFVQSGRRHRWKIRGK
jgi:uncharacterized protein (UPF0332 family)